MKFTPKSEEEITSENLLPAGIYQFEIVEAKEQVSKSQNEMIKLTLKVWDNDGGEHYVYDYLLESIAYKLRHAAEVCNLLDKYESGHLSADDFINKSGSLKLDIKKDKTNQYPDQNSVSDYVVLRGGATQLPATVLSDEIPFG
jgi:hypothetical protein